MLSSSHAIQLADAQALPPGLMLYPVPAPVQAPAQASPYFHQGLVKLHSGEARDAVQLFSQAVELAPDFAPAQVCLGVAHALTYDIYAGLDHLQAAIELEPDSFTAHYVLAQLYFKLRIVQKGYEQARAALDCPQTLENRKMLLQLLKEERVRGRQGIDRPWFNKEFRASYFWIAGSGLATVMLVALVHANELGRLFHALAFNVH